jgi:Glucose-6-phosphate dehydrogenase subunit
VPAVSDAVWSEQDTTPDAIEAALRRLLIERHAENAGYVPARVLNMITFVEHEWSGEIANRLRGVGRYHASRTVVLSYEPRRERLDAIVSVASDREPQPGEVTPLRETVIVEIGDRHLDDLVTIADPLVVTDLPTLLWSPHGHREAADALLGLGLARCDRPRLAAVGRGLRGRPRLAALDSLARADRRGVRLADSTGRA